MALSENLVGSNAVGDFTETVEFAVLSCGNIQSNNNKYYCLELQKSPNTGQYRLFCTRGRIGSTAVYGVRGPVVDQSLAKSEFDKIVKSKTKGKSGGEVSKYTLVETLKPSVGSPNICNQTSFNIKVSKPDLSNKIRSFFSPEESRIIQQAYDENIHQIQATTTINVTTNGLETALGPVTPEHVRSARSILDQLKGLQKQNRLMFGDPVAVNLNNQYISMIPRRVSARITENEMVLSDKKLLEEFDLLDQLESAVQINATPDKNDKEFHFGFKMTKNPAVLKEVSEWFERTRAHNHSMLSRWKVSNVFEVTNEIDSKRFSQSKVGGKTEVLWHGSRNCNVLSILMNALMVPRHNAPHVTGRMFGDGVYGASNSTKALNYSTGYWGGGTNKHPNSFLFVVNFRMGNVYYPTSSLYNGPPKGYHSVHAKKDKASLLNDEYVVYSLDQQKIVRLVELNQR